MKKSIHIYDIDGVLVDSSRRYRETNGKIDLNHWTANRNQSQFADCLLPMAEQFTSQVFNPDMFVGIATARQLTLEEYIWLSDNLPVPHMVVSRAAGDERSSICQKVDGIRRELAKFFRYPYIPPIYYYDDNLTVAQGVAAQIGGIPVHVPSNQAGHI